MYLCNNKYGIANTEHSSLLSSIGLRCVYILWILMSEMQDYFVKVKVS